MSTTSSPSPIGAALSDPLYYLRNFRTLVEWVRAHHGDLLDETERARIAELLELPQAAQALLVRMLMRRGEAFRLSRLRYEEIGSIPDALSPLLEQGWIESDPLLDIDTLGRLLTRIELIETLDPRLAAFPPSTSKADLLERLAGLCGAEQRTLNEWAPTLDDQVVQLCCGELFTRLQLMFFGNLSQDLSAFVLTELGYHRFEPVPFSPESRAFATRQEVDSYLRLHGAREALAAGQPIAEIQALVPDTPLDNAWLERRRGRLLFELARHAERNGGYDEALLLYGRANHPEARQRQFRVLELNRPDRRSYDALLDAIARSERPGEREALSRIERRLSRKLGLKPQTALGRPKLPQFELTLPGPAAVELSVARHLNRDDAPVYYVENGLLNGLFALLCWPALYAALPGAFFHPFQAAPADLGNADFVHRRQPLFARALETLQTSEYRRIILERHREKAGITCPFIDWRLLTDELISTALHCIPAQDLDAMIRRLLEDIPAHRSGLPDLIQFFPDAATSEGRPSYRLIEVKGPGDRVQDHQRRWLEYLHRKGIEVGVCYLNWYEG